MGDVGTDTTSFPNTGLSCGTQYFYRVYAYNAGGNSGYSNVANANRIADPLALVPGQELVIPPLP